MVWSNRIVWMLLQIGFPDRLISLRGLTSSDSTELSIRFTLKNLDAFRFRTFKVELNQSIRMPWSYLGRSIKKINIRREHFLYRPNSGSFPCKSIRAFGQMNR